jgi:AcrR family transcriptional regulator
VGPIDFDVIELLEEMDHGKDGVGEVRDGEDKVAAVLPGLTHIPNSNNRDSENEQRCPARISQWARNCFAAPSNSSCVRCHWTPTSRPAICPKKPIGGNRRACLPSERHWRPLASPLLTLASDTLMYPDAPSYANCQPMSDVKRLTRAEKQAVTRAALLESAANVFARRGYQAATVEEISESAGFSRGAFYSNFDSKEELFLTLIESRTEGNLRDIAAAFQKGDTAEERIGSGGAFLDSMAGRERQWCVLYMELWAQAVRDPKLRRRFSKQYEVWRDGIAHMVEARYEELGLEPDGPPRELASGLIALFEGQVLQRLIDPSGLDDGFFTRLMLRFFGRVGAFESA